MNIRDLQYLVAVAELQHFGRAAERCHASQPTLSMQIRKLEDQLGVALFERSGRRVLITSAGEQIVERARILIRDYEELQSVARRLKDPTAGHYRLGVFPTLAPYLLPRIDTRDPCRVPAAAPVAARGKNRTAAGTAAARPDRPGASRAAGAGR